MTNSPPAPAPLSSGGELRLMMGMWALAAVLPLPILVATDPASSAEIACIYLGVLNAWLVTEFRRSCGLPASPASWRVRTMAVGLAVFINTGLFIGFGLAADVQTHFPFPLMAALSVVPALGVMPWMLRRVSRQPYAAIIFTAFLIFACKLAGCVVARFVYGPDFLERGYVAGDWRTAKLMITLFWSFSALLSLGLFFADYRCCARKSSERAV